jgi:hypothetical protein
MFVKHLQKMSTQKITRAIPQDSRNLVNKITVTDCILGSVADTCTVYEKSV